MAKALKGHPDWFLSSVAPVLMFSISGLNSQPLSVISSQRFSSINQGGISVGLIISLVVVVPRFESRGLGRISSSLFFDGYENIKLSLVALLRVSNIFVATNNSFSGSAKGNSLFR